MSKKKKPDQNAQADNEDREQLRSMIDDREREYELQLDVQAQLTRIQEDLRHHENQLEALNADDDCFLQNQNDLLKGLVVLDEELAELEDEVGEDFLKRIGQLYFSVKELSKALIEWANSGEMDRSCGSVKFRKPDEKIFNEATSDETPPAEEKKPAVETVRKGRISSITIENFKGIGEKVTIPLKPITLLFGANSAGKSTVLQALLYAHEVMNNRNPDADVTEFGGEKINLGGFRNLVHGHDLTKEIKIGFEYTLSDDGLPLYGFERNYSGDLYDGFFYDSTIFKELRTVYVCFSVEKGRAIRPMVSRYTVFINGIETVAIILDPTQASSTPCLADLQLSHVIDSNCGLSEAETTLGMESLAGVNVVRRNLDLFIEEHPDHPPADCNDFVDEDGTMSEENAKHMLVESLSIYLAGINPLRLPAGNALPVWGEVIPFEYDPKALVSTHSSPIRHPWAENEDTAIAFAALSAIIAGPGELVANELNQVRYIGPIRAMPPRNYLPQKTMDAGRWADGMAGWDFLFNDIIVGREWFKPSVYEQLNLGYEFRGCWEMIIPADELETNSSTTLMDVIPEMSGKDTVRMRDTKNKTDVEPCDVGTGVSQVIPVVAGAMAPGCQFLSVEQPELHLHPAIQCNLGDLFISQSKRYPERTFLLETHSEHLILRLLRRIRETSDKSLLDPSLALTPEQVGVLYVSEAENGVSVKELPITSDGDFAEKWPQGFFEERAEELF